MELKKKIKTKQNKTKQQCLLCICGETVILPISVTFDAFRDLNDLTNLAQLYVDRF